MSTVTRTQTATRWKAYAPGSRIDHFAWWSAEHCRHVVGPFAGQPLVYEPWQLELFGEGMAVDEFDLPYWTTVVAVLPRKNGKTTGTGAIAGYETDEEEETPIVGLAATSDDQAGELFDAVGGFIGASPYLDERFHIRDYDGEIARTDGGAYIRRMRMDWRRLHGKNLSKLLADEIHAWSTPNLRKCWEALTTGDGARPTFQTWCITTEGEPDPTGESILSQLVKTNELYGDVERIGALTISRNHEARTLIYRWSAAMPAADPQPVRDAYGKYIEARKLNAKTAPKLRRDYEAALQVCVKSVKAANPASWITERYLARKVLDPKISRSSFLRYHACVSTSEEAVWFSEETLNALHRCEAARGQVAACIDGSRNHDTTAVAWASYPDADGFIDVECHVFSARRDAPHHEFCPYGRIDYDRVEEFVTDDLRAVVSLEELVFDPRYLLQSADRIEKTTDIPVAPLEPQSKEMRDALSTLHRIVTDGKLRIVLDPVVAAHFAATSATEDAKGWVIRKQKHSRPIDAVIAIAGAVWRASLGSQGGSFLY